MVKKNSTPSCKSNFYLVILCFCFLLTPDVQAQFPQPESPVSCDEGNISEPIPINYGDHTTGCSISPATDRDRFSFSGVAGELVRFSILSRTNGFDPVLEIRDPDEDIVPIDPDRCTTDRFNTCSFLTDLTLTKSGTYLVAIRDAGTNETGNYFLQIQRLLSPLSSPQLLYDVSVTDTINPGTDTDFLAFIGERNTTILFNVLSRTNGLDPALTIRDPDGAIVPIDPSFCITDRFNTCSFSTQLTLNKSGTYHIALRDAGTNETGTYEISLQCVSVSCPDDEIDLDIISEATLEGDQADAQSGFAVANAGDVNGDGLPDMIVGLPLFDTGVIDAGAVRLFLAGNDGFGASFSQQLEGNQAGARFGHSVAGVGDIDNDGFDDVAVGAPDFSDGQSKEGAVFLYLGNANGLTTTPVRILQSDLVGAEMGFSVAGAGDINGDGFSDVITGLPGLATTGAHGAGINRGADINHGAIASLLGALRDALATQADIFATGDQEGDRLGENVAGIGDVNGDGVDDFVGGAPGHDREDMVDVGMARIYAGSASDAIGSALVSLIGNSAGERLGVSAAGLGDINGDGLTDIAIGAPGFSNGQSNEGAIKIYQGATTDIPLQPVVTLQSDLVGAHLGESIASVDFLNGDGSSDIIAGAPGYSNGQADEGATYLFRSIPSGLYDPIPLNIFESNQAQAREGQSCASVGGLSANRYSRFAIGRPLADLNQRDEGLVTVYSVELSGRIIPSIPPLFVDDFED